jgi:asparagine synthase (glutamine-hydrolysing)
MDEPIADPAVIPAYLVCQHARKSATVLLSGVGGDELFAGYRKYSAHYWAEAYRRMPVGMQSFINSSVLLLPGFRGHAIKGSVRLAKKMAKSASLSAMDAFVMNCTYMDEPQKAALYAPSLLRELAYSDPANRHREEFQRVQHADFLNQMLYVDSKIFMASLNLTYNDKMSMASSVEVRVPLLDRELAEFVAREVPPAMKIKGRLRPTTKYIFRESMKAILPKEVLRQPKAGFAAPVDYWLANELRETVDDLLSESQLKKRGLFRPEVVRCFIDEHRRGTEDWSMQIWQFLTLELWMQTFLDQSLASSTAIPALQVATA